MAIEPIERDISSKNEKILYCLIEARNDYARQNIELGIKVNEKLCREIGEFNYAILDNEKDMRMDTSGTLFIINETRYGLKSVNLIYDEKGRYIGQQKEDKEIELEENIEIDIEKLKMQIDKTEQIEQDNEDEANSGSAKGGDGRDKAEKEHEEEPKKEEEKEEPQKNKGEKPKLKIWSRDELNLDYMPKFSLDDKLTINGKDLYQILQIQNKLGGKLPKGLDASSFRHGYLTIVDSKKLEAIDGKPRKAEDTFMVTNSSGQAVELDEKVLEPKPLGGLTQRANSAKTSLDYGDGVEAEKPSSETQVKRTSLYRIPDVHSNFGVGDNYFLAVNKDWDRMTKGNTPVDNYEKKVSFIQVSRNQSQYTSDEIPQNALEYELDPVRENTPKNEQEKKKDEELAKSRPNEVEVIRNKHFEELADEILNENGVVRRSI